MFLLGFTTYVNSLTGLILFVTSVSAVEIRAEVNEGTGKDILDSTWILDLVRDSPCTHIFDHEDNIIKRPCKRGRREHCAGTHIGLLSMLLKH